MNSSRPSEVGVPSSSAAEPAAAPPRWWFREWGLPVLAVLVLGPILIWLRVFYTNPLWGLSVVSLGTLAFGGALVLILLFWFCLFSYFSRRTVLAVMIPLLLVTAGWAASIRNVKIDGDMQPIFIYRWDPIIDPQVAQESQPEEAEEFVLSEFDVPAFRGRRRDGIFPGPVLNADWQTEPPRELWRTSVGEGYASMSLVGDRLVTLEQRGQNEAVTCYHAGTGQLRWLTEYPARFYEAMGGLGPRSTPTIDEGQVFVMGATGIVTCLDLYSGQIVWKRSLLEELGNPNITWGMSSSPLVLGDQVIVNPGGPQGNGLMSLDRHTGQTIWQGAGLTQFGKVGGQNLAGYSSPMLMEVDGIEQIVIFDGHGLSGHDPLSGTQWWHFQHTNDAGVNVAQPILLEGGKEFLISASYGMGSALVRVQKTATSTEGEPEKLTWTAERVWHDATLMRCKFTNPVLHEGFVYGLDEGILSCIDPRTGTRKWKNGRYRHGQVLLTNGQLLIISEAGDLALVEARPDRFSELASMPALPKSRVWNQHTLVNGIVYVRDDNHMAAYDLRASQP